MDYRTAATASPKAEREPNYNERLNRLSTQLQDHCDRIEAVLCRANGTPQSQNKSESVAQITPTLPLATVVDHLEGAVSRLRDLAITCERIA